MKEQCVQEATRQSVQAKKRQRVQVKRRCDNLLDHRIDILPIERKCRELNSQIFYLCSFLWSIEWKRTNRKIGKDVWDEKVATQYDAAKRGIDSLLDLYETIAEEIRRLDEALSAAIQSDAHKKTHAVYYEVLRRWCLLKGIEWVEPID
jgi:hypothetical protein